MDPIRTIDDASLQRMERRAWRDAARCWQDYRSNRDPGLSNVLNEIAWSAEHFWRHLHDERVRRGLAIAA